MIGETVPYSAVIIAPNATRDAANQLSVALGYAQPGDATYGRALLTGDVQTHWGTHTWVSASFLAMIDNARNGILPESLSGYAPEQVQALIESLMMSVREGGEPLDHWYAVLAANGLSEPVYEGEA